MGEKYLREIKNDEMKKWYPQKQSVAIEIIENFLSSDMMMAEVNLSSLPEVKSKKGSPKSTKQDSFASSFYAWKKKKSTKERLKRLRLDIILIRRVEKVALKKKKQGEK